MPGARSVEGSLTIVGAGIRPGLQTSPEARAWIRRATKVLYLLAEDAPTSWIGKLNPSAESLAPLYELGREHDEVYEALVEAMLAWVRKGEEVCVISYGNPAVFDRSTQDALERARAEGFEARCVPGISALDCLFVDLELDPGARGFQSYEASEFLRSGREPDTNVPLVLWQISVIGATRTRGVVDRTGLGLLATRLEDLYGANHAVTVYEASPFPAGRPLILRCPVSGLNEAEVTGLSTLLVPPLDV